MINLEEYGFEKTSTTDRWEEYRGHDFIVTIYNYMVTTFDKVEVARHVFVVNSKQFTSRARPIYELADWMEEKKIQKHE